MPRTGLKRSENMTLADNLHNAWLHAIDYVVRVGSDSITLSAHPVPGF